MVQDKDEPESYRLAGLTELQTGTVFLTLASIVLLFVGYQILIGRVFTKSGEMPLSAGLPWAFLTIETVAAAVGIIRGVRMVRK